MLQWVGGCAIEEPVKHTSLIAVVTSVTLFSVLKLIEIVILWVYYNIPFDFTLFRHFLGITFQLLNYFVWLRIPDEGSVPVMRMVHIVNLIRFRMAYTSK